MAVVVVPQSLAYAEVAGMPAHRGLYAAALPPLAAALFASSPYLQTGPVAITSLLTFGALSSQAPPGSDRYVALGLLLAILVGLARVALGLLRAGVLAYLLSEPVLLGFVPGAALLIIGAQVPDALGVEGPGGGVLGGAGRALAEPGAWRPGPLALAALTLALVLGGRRLHPLFPGVLVAVALGLAATLVGAATGATVGPIPGGLPPLSLALPLGALPGLLVPALVIALVGFAEPASIARRIAAEERRRWDPDREFVSQGVANLAAGVSGGFPVGGSFSRSFLNRQAGARTRRSGAVTGLAVLAFLPFAAALEPLPLAVLAAVVIAAVAGLVDVRAPLRLWRLSKPQALVAWGTFALTLALAPHVERAVLAGVALAIGVHLWRELSMFEVGAESQDHVLHLRPVGVLWFATARAVEDALLDRLAEQPDAQEVVVHLDGLGRIDLTGALALRSLLEEARRTGLRSRLDGVPPPSRPLIRRVLDVAEERPRGDER